MAKIFTKLNVGEAVATSGTRVFKKLTTESLPTYTGGLYDSNNRLVASWDTLVNTYGMDIEKDYTSETYLTDTASPYCVLTNNSELSNGTKLVIDDSVTAIGGYSFCKCGSLTDIILGNSVTSIGAGAFNSCTNLTSITIPNSVTSIGLIAFGGCKSLTAVHITDIVSWCGISFVSFLNLTSSNPLYYAGNLYLNGELVTDLVIPNGVTQISNYAFNGYTGLTSVTIPGSVTTIGSNAFGGCTSLTGVTIPGSVTTAAYAFKGCTSLNDVTILEGVTTISESMFEICTNLTSITIPNGVTTIETNAFDLSGLKSIVIPTSVTTIGKWAFASCKSLKDVYYCGTEEQWNAIDVDAYYNGYLVNTATKHFNYKG